MSTFTVKYAKDFDAPWYVAEGNPEEIKQQLILFFDLQGADEKSAHEVGLEATQIAQATWAAAKGLNAKPSNEWPSDSDRGARRKSKPVEQGKLQDPKQAILDDINAATNKPDLVRIWLTVSPELKKDAAILESFKSKSASFQ